MKIRKKLNKLLFVQSLISFLGYVYIWFVHRTTRWKFLHTHNFNDVIEANEGAIFVFFHNRLAMMPFAWKSKKKFHMLLSNHADGRIIANVIRYRGILSLYGSTAKNGASAFISLLRVLKNKGVVGITPDGPRGPNEQISPGVIKLAQATGVKVLPLTYSISRFKRLRSWDKFVLPLPFSKGSFIYGKPLTFSKDQNIDESCLLLQQALFDIQQECDTLVSA
ncbi:MAG: hypothetical protein C0432_01760 [Candidatus Puniceispirillum sp.]|nr:hypothetical protein [Candidatus Pelagibacter sp.]MBA4283002.1 hypothetical protein [Candidatus Puniceispirillum sp.]